MESQIPSFKDKWRAVLVRAKIPTRSEIRYAIQVMPFRKRLLLLSLFIVFLGSALGVVWGINNSFMVTVPASGGTLREGQIGSPRFINPLLAISDADRDLTALVYSGLVRVNGNNKLVPDLAESYDVSADNRVYTFRLREDLRWHDGKPLTADDVEFTVKKAQDLVIKSPKRASWEGVSVELINDREIRFTLKQPYSAFLENATLGIMPKHLWADLQPEAFSLSDLNTNAIGSGPYKITQIKKGKDGLPLYYELEPFRHFALGKPKISRLVIRFYGTERDLLNAYRGGDIQSVSAIPPAQAQELKEQGANILEEPLPRVFGIFFNQNNAEVLSDKTVRKALDLALDKELIVQQVLKGYGAAIYSPLPPGAISSTSQSNHSTSSNRTSEAIKLLTQSGWNKDSNGLLVKKTKSGSQKLTFVISTSDTPELKAAGELIRDQWRKLGADVDLKVYEIGDLNQNIIRPRKYQALFFGEILGREPDPFPFWHSSQRLDPGLNIALYTNSTVDKILEQARGLSNPEERSSKYEQFDKAIASDVPAVFVYSPHFIYVIPSKIKNVTIPTITTPAERFSTIHTWYLKTDRVWKIFAQKTVN